MGVLGLIWAIAGPAARSFGEYLLIVPAAFWAVLALWGFLEYEFAWPGILVPKGLRGTPGMRSVVRTRRHARDGPPEWK